MTKRFTPFKTMLPFLLILAVTGCQRPTAEVAAALKAERLQRSSYLVTVEGMQCLAFNMGNNAGLSCDWGARQ